MLGTGGLLYHLEALGCCFFPKDGGCVDLRGSGNYGDD